jgi:hypothetical protein
MWHEVFAIRQFQLCHRHISFGIELRMSLVRLGSEKFRSMLASEAGIMMIPLTAVYQP